MDKAEVLTIIDRYRLALEKRGVHVSKIILFGSYARGNWREGSDIDLLIVSDSFVGKDFWERLHLLADAICELWEPIESIAMTQEEWERGSSMAAQFAREGEVAYSAA